MRAVLLALGIALGMAGCAEAKTQAPAPGKKVAVGVAADPEQFAALARVQLPVSIRATFEAWSLDRVPSTALDIARGAEVTPMITWEPWEPTAPGAVNRTQPRFANAAIAAGTSDAYVRSFARAMAAFGRPVYLRFAHEMNGTWYPWSIDPAAYRRAWRHVWRVFRQERATNVRWVWSANLNTFQEDAAFVSRMKAYWPGQRYVDVVGVSLVRFLTQRERRLAWSFRRMEHLRRFRRPFMLTEVKAPLEEARGWLHALRCAIGRRSWVTGLVWSETPSRLAERDRRVGNMSWSLLDAPWARGELRRIAEGAGCSSRSR